MDMATKTNVVNVDFNQKVGEFKDVNGVNCAPYSLMAGDNQKGVIKHFTTLNIPYSRLHDVEGRYGGCNYVDIPNVFRNFDADENDPENYDFHYTDEYLKPIFESGANVIYRLGITIEWGSKKYRTFPPKDYAKWARICEHVIMHYNEGWANGFNYNIEYWEIWNEPENPPMWSGTREEFFELYKVSACYLKQRFPNIKLGGYGSCGFYAVTRENMSDFYKGFVTWFHEFLKMCKSDNIPLDFYSWHLYTDKFDEFVAHAKYVRETLDEYGFANTESHFNEWNVGGEGGGYHLMRTMVGASYIGSVLCEMQNTSYIDKAMYYVFSSNGGYNGFFDLNVKTPTCTYYAMKGFGDCYALKSQVKAQSRDQKVKVVAGYNGEKGAVLVSNYDSDSTTTTLTLKGLKVGAKISVSYVKIGGELDTSVYENSCDTFAIGLNLPTNSVVTVSIE